MTEEHPKLLCQLIEVSPKESAEGVWEKVQDGARTPLEGEIRYRHRSPRGTALRGPE